MFKQSLLDSLKSLAKVGYLPNTEKVAEALRNLNPQEMSELRLTLNQQKKATKEVPG